MIDLDSVSHLNVLFVGDAIWDEYVYVKTIGKAVKENALSAISVRTEMFEGGVLAAAKHTQNFCAIVNEEHSHAHGMRNSRIVDDVYLRKLFVTHTYVAIPSSLKPKKMDEYDLVVVTDFGNGTMDKAMIEKVSREARYLAVNAQTNSMNYGFNLVSKYPRADLVVVDELEARLAAADKESRIEDVILALGFERIIVTMGTKGAVGYDGAFEYAPALTDKVVDSMGAGDAFLAVVSPFAAIGAPMKDLLRIGNAAGAVKVGIVGHRESVTKEALRKMLDG